MKYKKKQILKAHHYASYHKGALELFSDKCLCFYCKQTFKFENIKEWIDDGETALCPFCGIDAVLGNKNPFCEEFPVDDPVFANEMHELWFR